MSHYLLSRLGLDYVFNAAYQPQNFSTFPKADLTPLQWHFQTKLRPKVLKIIFCRPAPASPPPPHLRVWMTSSLLSQSLDLALL